MVGVVLVAIGLYGVWVAVQALRSGEVEWLWTHLDGWGFLGSSFGRAEHPIAYWIATVTFAVMGVGLTVFGVWRLLGS